jgi:hypothetical protein
MPVLNKTEIKLPTGTLEIATEHIAELNAFCDFAARANPKRGFLIVSKVLGRHLPASPEDMRGAMDELGKKLPADLDGPIVILGMAETATALGQGVFAAYQKANPRKDVVYLQSSRQIVDGTELIASFEEGHSHATTHLIQVADLAMQDDVRAARTLVIVDDECSTGNTFVAVANAMMEAMPNLELVATCCITDWSGGNYIRNMPRPTLPVSIISGSMTWTAGDAPSSAILASGSNVPGRAPKTGMKSRSGLYEPEQASRSEMVVASDPQLLMSEGEHSHKALVAAGLIKPSERILVLGEGEHSYEALLVAEEIERKGGVAAVQCITRSPALLGFAMETKSSFSDSYGSGAPCFLYNILKHNPDRVIIVAEQIANQEEEARAALRELGSSIPVDVVLCGYAKGE